jgi:hypothetical protein
VPWFESDAFRFRWLEPRARPMLVEWDEWAAGLAPFVAAM